MDLRPYIYSSHEIDEFVRLQKKNSTLVNIFKNEKFSYLTRTTLTEKISKSLSCSYAQLLVIKEFLFLFIWNYVHSTSDEFSDYQHRSKFRKLDMCSNFIFGNFVSIIHLWIEVDVSVNNKDKPIKMHDRWSHSTEPLSGKHIM